MTSFAILSGKSLKSAIAGYGKIAATFSQKTHQLAYSALDHVEQHHDAIYCNAIYSATPKNYRASIVKWLTAFGKVSFDTVKLEFTYSKGKKSDLSAALLISPADYEKEAAKGKESAPKSMFEKFEGMLKTALDKGGLSLEDERFADFMEIQLGNYAKILKRQPLETAKPESNVVPMTEAPKEAAPVASKPKADESSLPEAHDRMANVA